MKIRYLFVLIVILAAPLGYLGFNTIEWMTQRNQLETWYFMYPNKFGMPFWWAYFLGGILPFWTSGFLIGLICGYMLKGRKKKDA